MCCHKKDQRWVGEGEAKNPFWGAKVWLGAAGRDICQGKNTGKKKEVKGGEERTESKII